MKLWRKSRPIGARRSAHYEHVLGTSLEILATVESDAAWSEVVGAVLARIDTLEAIFSCYKPESEFMRWQQTRDESLPVSRELAIVLDAAERFRSTSKNAFCPIADALADEWKDGRTTQPQVHNVPLWSVDLANGTATRHTHRRATLNAIAKGFIIDEAVQVAFSSQGVTQALVNIGGDLKHLGNEQVQIQITDPTSDGENAKPLQIVRLSNQAIATSGGYRRGYWVDGVWHSHVFDPISGRPTEAMSSTSVIAETAMEADAVATVAGVLPERDAIDYVNSLNRVGVLIVNAEGAITSNEAWNRHIMA
jgi:thiamine biosynthesis lipoprotein